MMRHVQQRQQLNISTLCFSIDTLAALSSRSTIPSSYHISLNPRNTDDIDIESTSQLTNSHDDENPGYNDQAES